MPRYDLHCHSTHSDGLLPPAEVVRRAASRGVEVLALTDHDETSGLAEARVAAADAGLRFVDGAELSVSWNDVTLHVVALGIDPNCRELLEGLAAIRAGRDQRARLMADSLAKAGIEDAYEGAAAYVTNERLIGGRILRGSWSTLATSATPRPRFSTTSPSASPATSTTSGPRCRRRSG